MKVGVQLPEVERELSWRELSAMARAAEECRLDSVWVGDHLLYRNPNRGPWEAWSTLAAVAAVTSRVEVGPLVACLGFHNPAVVAKMAATVDEIAGGRLVLGVGSGWNRDEFDAFGIPFDHRVERFAESFTIVRRLLAGETVDHDGEYSSARGCVLLPRPRRVPPLMIGSTGPRMLQIALPHVDIHHAWFEWFGNSVSGFRALQTTIDDACRAAGREPSSVQRAISLYVQMPDGVGRLSGNEASRSVAPIPATELPATLAQFEEAGADHVQLVLDPITVESIEAVAR